MDQFIKLLKARGVTQPPTKDIRVIGIDLGTTNSTVSEITWSAGVSAPDQVRTIEVDQETPMGRYTNVLVPSMVCVQETGPLVGEGVKVLRGKMSDPSLGFHQYRNIFWECKNHMGLTRTYRAPAGFRSAKEIGGQVLKFLLNAALKEDATHSERVVVTVPASFRIPQRQDTQAAAELAGVNIGPGDLVDEPVAAFLDYIFSHDVSKLELTGKPKNVLVFDFGGGTCDVAIFRVSIAKDGGQILMAPLTVSRYHRLGGGDIDAAIVHEVLIPQIVEQNHLPPFDLAYEDKAYSIAPAFLSIAEALKIGLCKEIARLKKLGKYPDGEDRKTVFKKNPGLSECRLKDGRVLSLQSPILDAVRFEALLQPFLDRDFLFARESEYRMTCSIFSPLTDALNRAGLKAEDIAVCLMAGSSAFIPKVQEELDQYFTNGFVLNFATPEDAKLAISRGAAYHAMALALTGRGVVQPVASDGILLQTNHGSEQLVPAGAPLPYPDAGKWAEVADLKVPTFAPKAKRDLRLELVTPDQMRLFQGIWPVPPGVKAGAPIRFRYVIDENQIMSLRVNVSSAPPEEYWQYVIENPLVNVELGESKREEIENLEENIRTGQVPRAEIPETTVRIADLTAELGQRERALALMKQALAGSGGQDAGLLNKMGILCSEMKDDEKAEKFYRTSAEAGSWGVPLFNLALLQRRRGELPKATKSIEEAIARSKVAPYLVLRALLADTQQDPMGRDAFVKEAMDLFGSVAGMSDWELGWYLTAADMLHNDEKAKEAKEEQRNRSKRKNTKPGEGLLPDRGTA